MSITKVTPLAVRRVLWAEDEPEDLEGTPEMLRYIGHQVLDSTDFESTVEYLSSEQFDLLVLDQRMPMAGRRSDDAGAQLVTQLAAGDFGELNIDIPFLFVTASVDWVLECGIDVTGLPGFLDILEKGDELTGPLERYLDELPRRGGAPAQPVPLVHGEGPEDELDVGSIAAIDGPELTEEWHGVVLEIGAESFRARLASIGGPLPDYEVSLPFAAIATDEHNALSEGATFTWSLAVGDHEEGQRVTVSRITFGEPAEVTDEEIVLALARARARKNEQASLEAHSGEDENAIA